MTPATGALATGGIDQTCVYEPPGAFRINVSKIAWSALKLGFATAWIAARMLVGLVIAVEGLPVPLVGGFATLTASNAFSAACSVVAVGTTAFAEETSASIAWSIESPAVDPFAAVKAVVNGLAGGIPTARFLMFASIAEIAFDSAVCVTTDESVPKLLNTAAGVVPEPVAWAMIMSVIGVMFALEEYTSATEYKVIGAPLLSTPVAFTMHGNAVPVPVTVTE